MSYEDVYYIRDTRGTVGNSVTWWAWNGKGYTCDLRRAGIYSKQDAEKICRNRDTDKMYPVKQVIRLVQHHVDCQDLSELNDTNSSPHTMKDWDRFEK